MFNPNSLGNSYPRKSATDPKCTRILTFTAHICTCTHRGECTHTHTHTHTHPTEFLQAVRGFPQPILEFEGFPGGTMIKKPPATVGDIRDTGSVPGLGRSPGGGNGNPLQYFCLENRHGQSSLVDYSPWGHKESDKTEFSDRPVWLPWTRVFQEKPERINCDPTNAH